MSVIRHVRFCEAQVGAIPRYSALFGVLPKPVYCSKILRETETTFCTEHELKPTP